MSSIKTLEGNPSMLRKTHPLVADGRMKLLEAWDVIPLMHIVEENYRRFEEGTASLDQITPVVRLLNAAIESKVPEEEMRLFIQPGESDDRFRKKYFLAKSTVQQDQD
jgi:hypothetical protein